MFPYEEYQKAIDAESKIRQAGYEAVVRNVEQDETQPDCHLLGVELRGTCDEGMLEDGTVLKDGKTIGNIVSVDTAAGIVVVKGEGMQMPSIGDTVHLQPPDYLQKLREFSTGLLECPDLRNESRFLALRETLLASAQAKTVKTLSQAYLRDAQYDALCETESLDFSFVWGPPGTGKSYTLGHIAAHYRAQGKRVLLLSTTNAAVDVTTFAIDNACLQVEQPLNDGDLVRYSRVLTQREEYDRRPHLMAFTKLLVRFMQKQRELERKQSDADHRLRELEPGAEGYQEAFLKLSAIQGQLRRLAEERKAEIGRCLDRAQIVCCTVMSCLYNGFAGGKFDVILVDEASLIPLAVWPCLLNAAAGKKFVVAGDPMQLLPVQARDPEIATHIWFDNNIYTHLGMSTWRGIAPFYECGAVTLLNEQTRMRKGICNLVSSLFYNGFLKGDRSDRLPEWAGSMIPQGDVSFVDPAEQGEAHGIGRLPSAYLRNTNTISAGWVLDAIRALVRQIPADRKVSVLVVTPFRNQALRIYGPRLKKLADNRNVTVEVSTVHRCQGSEADIVIFDLVEPSSWFVNRPDAAHLWCVACSRARHRLVFVGDRRQMETGWMSGKILNHIQRAS